MKRATCISTLIALVLSTLTTTTSACPSECDTNDQACMNALLACVEESNTDATAGMFALVLAGAGIWWLASRDTSDSEEAELRLHEASLGLGYRITDSEKPYRVALFPLKDSKESQQTNINQFDLVGAQQTNFNGGLGLIAAEVEFD